MYCKACKYTVKVAQHKCSNHMSCRQDNLCRVAVSLVNFALLNRHSCWLLVNALRVIVRPLRPARHHVQSQQVDDVLLTYCWRFSHTLNVWHAPPAARYNYASGLHVRRLTCLLDASLLNNASANASVNADSRYTRIYFVHRLAYYRHDVAT